MDRKYMLSKIDSNLLDMVKEVSENTNSIEAILIGGRALNLLIEEERYSVDSDFGIKSTTQTNVSKNMFVNFCKKVRKKIEEKMSIKINRAENNEQAYEMELRKENYYQHIKFVIKMKIFIDNEYHMLEFSYDETIDALKDWEKKLGINVVPLEYILAVKTIIAAKRVDEGTIFKRDNFRHIYDIHRILNDKNLNYKKFMENLKGIYNYELSRPPENKESKYKFEMSLIDAPKKLLDFLNSGEVENETLLNGKFIKFSNNYEKIIYKNEENYGVKISSEEFKAKIEDHLVKLTKNI